MDLYYLIYTSTPAKILTEAELHDLLHTSRQENSRFEVTGMLICLPESYIQLIEGPKTHIEQLFHNIQQDKRHLRVTTLREAPIDNRFFPDWAMAFKRSDPTITGSDVLNLDAERVLQLFDILDY
jgi:hypothetical protein